MSLLDKAGRLFDPKKHIAKFHKLTGRWMPKGGRKPKMQTTTATPAPEPATAAAPATPAPAAQITPAAEPEAILPGFDDVKAALRSAPGEAGTAARAEALTEEISALGENPTLETVIGIIQTGLILIGEEEGILSDLEKQMLRRPLKRVLEKYNVGANVMPAEVDLALAVVGLFIARLTKPKTATFFAKCKHWVGQQIFRREGRKISAVVTRETAAEPEKK